MKSYLLQVEDGDNLLQRVKVCSAQNGITMKEFIVSALNREVGLMQPKGVIDEDGKTRVQGIKAGVWKVSQRETATATATSGGAVGNHSRVR